MKLRKSAEPEVADLEEEDAAAEDAAAGKGRPTPKRRDVVGPRGPVTAPKTRKEAMARQKELSKRAKTARTASAGRSMTPAERRAAMRSGEILQGRDQGPTKKLARDYVDSHRMFSNYLLWLFPLMIATYVVPAAAIIQLVIIAMFFGLIVEWYLVGGRIRRLAVEREGSAQGGAMSIGFYAGSRAYLPRRWRLPAPAVEIGDQI